MSYPVTELQLAILDVLWRKGEATVLEVHEELRADRRVAQSTVNTLLTRLEERRFVGHREDGRRYVYRAEVERTELRRSLVSEFLAHTRPLFDRDLGLLVSHLISERDGTSADLEEARDLLRELERRVEEADG